MTWIEVVLIGGFLVGVAICGWTLFQAENKNLNDEED